MPALSDVPKRIDLKRFMRLALREAARAGRAGEVPVGAVLVGAGGEVIILDEEFRKPSINPSVPVPPADGTVAEDTRVHVILETAAGEIEVVLDPSVAPKTVGQFIRLVDAGVYDVVRFQRLEPGFVLQAAAANDRAAPLTPEQQALIRRIPLEASGVAHERGMLSMARWDGDPDSAETSFSILLGPAPHLDGNYTVFGQVESGWNAIETIEAAPRKPDSTEPAADVRIIRARVVR